MRYKDATAKKDRKHIYAVRTVNTVGLKSEPTMAAETTASGTEQDGKVMPPEIMAKQWPQGPEAIKAPVPIKLEAKLLDACVSNYEFAPGASFPSGAKLKIWREGERLLAQPSVGNQSPGLLEIFPVSETNFFFKNNILQLVFVRNDKGDVVSVIRRASRGGMPDCLGRKCPDQAK